MTMNALGSAAKHLLPCIALPALIGCVHIGTPPLRLEFLPGQHLTLAGPQGNAHFRYNLKPPANMNLAIPSGGFFHPLSTPGGKTITDAAPDDHLHHRGLFIGFVEMHGIKDADFWGWGGYAPTNNRRIVNVSVNDLSFGNRKAHFTAHNHWEAENTVLIDEELRTSFEQHDTIQVFNLEYILIPKSDITVARWAFGGFCLRLRKDGAIEFASPKGKAGYEGPDYMKPETDWPDEPWYAAMITLQNGAKVGGAVINHPDNPDTLWHNHPATFMINPCITARRELKWKEGEPVVLKYRVVTFDHTVPVDQLNTLAQEW